MKTIIITIAFILCGNIFAYAQNDKIKIGTLESDSIAAMYSLYYRKSAFIGEKLSKFLKEYERYLPIRFMGAGETSPWIHPKGKSFIQDITICFRDYALMQRRYNCKAGNYVLNIEFMDTQMDYFTFWNQFSDTMTDQQKADFIGDKFYVKDITVYQVNKK